MINLKPKYSIPVKVSATVPQGVIDKVNAKLEAHNEEHDDKADLDYVINLLLEAWGNEGESQEARERRKREPKPEDGEKKKREPKPVELHAVQHQQSA